MINAKLMASLVLVMSHATAATAATCEWENPGRDPFRGSAQVAIMGMDGIPLSAKAALAWAVTSNAAHDKVLIWRDAISSVDRRITYRPDLWGMRFGHSKSCDITRATWTDGHAEPGKAWHSQGYCVVIPDICGNPSWTRCQLAANLPTRNTVPEPSTYMLVLAALAGCAAATRFAGSRAKG